MAVDSVRIVIFDAQEPDRFIVLCEADDIYNWKLPGGKFEPDETPEAAARRELIEELGLKIEQNELGTARVLLNNDGVSKRYIFQVLVEQARVEPSAEVAQLLWVTAATVPAGPNYEHIQSAVALAQR